MGQLNIRLPEWEGDHLETYCKITARTKTDVVREFIRSLSVPGRLPPIDSVFSKSKEN